MVEYCLIVQQFQDLNLGAVCAGARIRHRKHAGTSVLELEVLVSELGTIYGLSTSAITSSEVATLAHEIGNDTMKARALVAKPLLAWEGQVKSREVWWLPNKGVHNLASPIQTENCALTYQCTGRGNFRRS
jgi:hypothetical protein